MEVKLKRKVTKRSNEERKALCEQWKVSGKSKREFCKENNIPIASFFPWCVKFLTESGKQETNMVPVKMITQPAGMETQKLDTELELTIGGDHKLRFKLPIRQLVTFIQELSHAVTTIR